MGPVTEVTDEHDLLVADYVSLSDFELRTRMESAGGSHAGLFVAEGELVIRRVLQAGYRLRSLLLSPLRVRTLADDLRDVSAPVYVAAPEVMQRVTGFHVHRGALAAVERRPLPTATQVLASARRVLVLEDVNNHTNMGALFRACAGLGVDGVLLSPRCADPLYRRSVRVSMGAVLAVQHARLDSWPDVLPGLRGDGWTLLGLTPRPSAVPLPEAARRAHGRIALLLGAEGPGLSDVALACCDEMVRIPMSNGVESLNVAVAAAVACYALQTQP